MFAVMGITGQVGGAIARHLLRSGKQVRAVVRNRDKAREWEAQGCTMALADFNNVEALAAALAGTEGAFIMIPPYFAPSPGFPEAKAVLAALKKALALARPPKIVCLSSVGAHHASGLGLITQLHLLEEVVGESAPAVGFLRAAWFMENAAWDVAPARETGKIGSFLIPTDRAIPMVATDDIGRAGAALLLQNWSGRRILELEGPRSYSPNDLAAALARALGRPVVAELVPRKRWEELFRGQGTADPSPRIEMIDGFNSGWIVFDGSGERVLGETDLDAVVRSLVGRSRSS
jgi:uncharacterized protein YbjT (DUF2867 family)